jgi:hypothetical protein
MPGGNIEKELFKIRERQVTDVELILVGILLALEINDGIDPIVALSKLSDLSEQEIVLLLAGYNTIMEKRANTAVEAKLRAQTESSIQDV